MHMHAHAHACTCTYMHMHMHVHAHACARTCMQHASGTWHAPHMHDAPSRMHAWGLEAWAPEGAKPSKTVFFNASMSANVPGAYVSMHKKRWKKHFFRAKNGLLWDYFFWSEIGLLGAKLGSPWALVAPSPPQNPSDSVQKWFGACYKSWETLTRTKKVPMSIRK
jgi:hypothetical protein